jgi:hypothetical protein
MSRDLSRWRRPLEPECKRLDTHDEGFQAAAAAAQKEQYTEAADKVEALLDSHLYDVRLLGYPFLAAVLEDGLARLPEVLETLAECFHLNWKALPEGDTQAKLLDKGLTWFFRTLTDRLGFHQARQDEAWQGWLKDFPEARAAESLQRARALQPLLAAPMYRDSSGMVVKLTLWLQDLQGKLAQARPPPEPARSTPTPGAPPAAPAAPASPAASPSTFLRLGQEVRLHGSAHFVELCNKLQAFELLVQREDFEKAALVSDDILALLEGFDPRRYFPQLFASFGALLNRHVQELQPHWERKESVEWKTLTQFYQVDLEGFVGKKE